MKQAALFLLGIFSVIYSFSQTGSITGKLSDSASGKALAFATVTVFKAKDTAIVTYRLTNPEGAFKVGGLPMDIPLRVIITFSGYQAFRKEFELNTANPSVNFNMVKLPVSSNMLDEVVVIAERPPVIMKNDTIECQLL